MSDPTDLPVAAPGADFNFARHLLALNAGRPDKAAFVDDLGTLTFRALDERVRRLASGLRTQIAEGDPASRASLEPLLAGVNTPLSMLITGMLIAAGDVRSIVTDKHIWKLASVRMLLIPAATLALFGALGFHGTAAQVVTLLECCPAAAITSVFAVQFGHDEHFAAGSVVLTTLLSIVTLPLCALIITMVM